MTFINALQLGFSSLVVAVALVSCGSGKAAPTGSDTTNNAGVNSTGESCTTPNDDCPCTTEGQVVACGKVQVKTGTTVTCEMGNRTCSGGHWSTCQGTSITTKALAPLSPTNGVGILALPIVTNQSAGCSLNLCDPYCNQFDNHPNGPSDAGADDSGFLITADAGLEPTPAASVVVGVLAGQVQVASTTGDTDCTPAPPNLHTGACTGSPYSSCQQDFRCDTGSNHCVWNGGEGYYDGTAGGPDLTMGAACSYGAGANFPVCNRGSTSIASGTVLNVFYSNTQLNGCAPPTGTPDCTGTTTAALDPGSCINLVCNAGSGKYAVITGVTEDANHCQNNGATIQVGTGCGTCQSCVTTVSGTVKDPGKNVGLSGVTVFQPNQTPAALTDFSGSPVCDSCSALVNPSTFITAANTGTNGSFSLGRAAPGPGLVVSQTGRWRRQAAVNLNACVNNTIADDNIRMPKNRAEGDIPKMALVIGDRESLECWVAKVGIDSNEIWPQGGTAPAVTAGSVTKPAGVDAARIQLFTANTSSGLGQASGRPSAPVGSNLWAAGGPLGNYSAVILPCDSGHYTGLSTGDNGRMANYAKAGGRLFMDHLTGSEEWLNGSNATSTWKATSTWQGNTSPTLPAVGYVFGGKTSDSTAQQALYAWMALNAPSTSTPTGAGYLNVSNPRADSLIPNSATTTEWLRGHKQDSWTGNYTTDRNVVTGSNYDYELSYSFDVNADASLTPSPGASSCGRVIYNGMHVSQTRATQQSGFGGTFATSIKFPTDCKTTALSSEELALEYQFFQLTACPYTPPPTPAPPAPPGASTGGNGTYTVKFTSDCATNYPGTVTEWGFFRWIADASNGTSIVFKARTADNDTDLATATDFTVGTANSNTTTWTNDASTMDQHFRNDLAPTTVVTSQAELQVSMVFTSNGVNSPILYDWRAEYSCVPNQ